MFKEKSWYNCLKKRLPRTWAKQYATFQGKTSHFQLDRQVVVEPMSIYAFTFDFTSINENDLLSNIRRDKQVLAAQFNHFVKERSTIPDDPFFEDQWQYLNIGQSGGTPGADFDMDLAWDLSTGGVTATGDTIVICVIDDGLELNS